MPHLNVTITSLNCHINVNGDAYLLEYQQALPHSLQKVIKNPKYLVLEYIINTVNPLIPLAVIVS